MDFVKNGCPSAATTRFPARRHGDRRPARRAPARRPRRDHGRDALRQAAAVRCSQKQTTSRLRRLTAARSATPTGTGRATRDSSACLVPYAKARREGARRARPHRTQASPICWSGRARCAARRLSGRCRGKAMFHCCRIGQKTPTTTTKINPFQLITINPNYSNKITKSSTSKPSKSHHSPPDPQLSSKSSTSLPSTHSPFTKTIKTPTTTSPPQINSYLKFPQIFFARSARIE